MADIMTDPLLLLEDRQDPFVKASVYLSLIFWFLSTVMLMVHYKQGSDHEPTNWNSVSSVMVEFLDKAFMSLVLVYIFLYFAYCGTVSVWIMLGAVINPQRFLPMTTACLVMLTFAISNAFWIYVISDELWKIIGELNCYKRS